MMSLKAAGIGGSIIVLIALVIAFMKSLIAFVGFVTFAVKILIVIVFLAVFVVVGLLAYRAWQDKKNNTI
jgi:hypothetical protein